jgi:hypothetical protein
MDLLAVVMFVTLVAIVAVLVLVVRALWLLPRRRQH